MVEKKTRANGRASRKAILEAAADVFAEKGYRGTSLTEIANRVGMTQPGLLHHFATKDELLLAVVLVHDEENTDVLSEDLNPDNYQLVASMQKLAASNARARQAQLLLTTLSAEAIPNDHPLHGYFVQRFRRYRRGLAKLIASAQKSGNLRDDVNAADLAREILATLDGLQLQWLLDPKEVNLKQAVRVYGERLERELVPVEKRTTSVSAG